MTNGADEQSCGAEHPPVAESGSVLGREIPEQSGGNSSGGALLPNPESDSLGLTSEWDSYIDTQKRHDWVDLSHEQRAFCEEFLNNGYDHREAAISVGRSPGGALKLLHKPLLREYICFVEGKRRDRRIVSERFLDAQLAQLYEQAVGEEEIPLVTGSGIKLTAKKFQGQLALGIIQERAKLSGVAKPEAVDTNISVVIDVGALIGEENRLKIVSEQ